MEDLDEFIESRVINILGRYIQDGNIPFELSNESGIVSRVRILESSVLLSDYLYKCDDTFRVLCSSMEEVDILRFLLSFSTLYCKDVVVDDSGTLCCIICKQEGELRVVTETVFRRNFSCNLSFTCDKFIEDFSLDNFYSKVSMGYLFWFFHDIPPLYYDEIVDSLKSRTLDSKFLVLGVLGEKVKYLYSKYEGLDALLEDDFQIDIRDFEKVFVYLNDRYRGVILRNYHDELKFDFDCNVVRSVDALFNNTCYTKLYSSLRKSDFYRILGTRFFL